MNKIKGIMNLPAKVAIKKSAVDIEGTDKAAERIHTPPPVTIEKLRKKTAAAPHRPAPPPVAEKTAAPGPKTRAKKSAAPVTGEPADLFGEPVTRITLDLPASLYKGAKIKSFTEMMTLRTYIIELLRADLNI